LPDHEPDARAERAILSSAEAYRLVNEAREQRERAERAEEVLRQAAAFWRPVARDLEHNILSIDSVRFLAQDFLAMLQPTLKSGGGS